jgi:hypothetical protein
MNEMSVVLIYFDFEADTKIDIFTASLSSPNHILQLVFTLVRCAGPIAARIGSPRGCGSITQNALLHYA